MPFPFLNEASNLIKMGVPKTIAQFIHKLEGEREQDYSQRRSGVTYQDNPVPHDVERSRKIKTKQAIIRYMKAVPEDSPLSAILVNPETGFYAYVSYKSEEVRGGNQYRVVTIDPNGNAIAKWDGTLGQLVSARTPDNLEMWVLDTNPEKVKDIRKTRKNEKVITDEQFVESFKNNYSEIFKKVFGASAAKKSEQFYAALTGLTPEDFISQSREFYKVRDLAAASKKDAIVETEINSKYQDFLRYLLANGDYEKLNYSKADINDVVKKHTMMGAFHKFAEFVMTGRVADTYKKDYLEELGF